MEIYEEVKQVFQHLDYHKLLRANAVYQIIPAYAEGDDIVLFDPADPNTELTRFSFPRQPNPPHLCLSDYLRKKDEEPDYLGLFAVTAGLGVREAAEALKEQGDYLRSHMVHALALELAEALAEKVHETMRGLWGFPDPPRLTMAERLAGRYQGLRASFGYPACPNLEDQAKLLLLLKAEEIGVNLTEGFMMDPEASVSALVFSRPGATYFPI